MKHNDALRSNLPKVQEDLNPIRVLSLFERISKEDCDLLDIHDRWAFSGALCTAPDSASAGQRAWSSPTWRCRPSAFVPQWRWNPRAATKTTSP